MASDSFNIDFNVGTSNGGMDNKELIATINNLSHKLSGFGTVVDKFISSANTYQKATSHMTPAVAAANARAREQNHVANQKKYTYLSDPAARNHEKAMARTAHDRDRDRYEAARSKRSYESSDDAQRVHDNNLKRLAVTKSLANAKNKESQANRDFESSTAGKKLRSDVLKGLGLRESIKKEGTNTVVAKESLAKEANRKHELNLAAKQESNIPAILRQTNIDYLKQQSKEAGDRGDFKEQKNLNKMIAEATQKGITEGVKKSDLKSLSMAGAFSLFTNGLSSYATTSGKIAQAGLSNPLTNNYDYGSPLSSAISLNSQRQTDMLSTGLTGVGGVLGGTAGALIGKGIGDFIGAETNATVSLQSQMIGEMANQNSKTSSLQGTNSRAFGIVSQGGYDPYSNALDVTKPLRDTIAKGVAVYDKNFKSVKELTDYAISAQIPMSRLGEFAGSMGQLRLTGSQFGNMAGLASTYGIDPVDLANKTVAFMQGGMSKGQAMNTAATSFQNSSGFQSWQTGYLQGGYLDRDISAVLGKAVGLDTEGIAKNDPKAIAALRSMQQKASKGYGTDAGREERAKLQVAGFGQSTYNINSPETSRFLGARMTPGLPQQGELDKFNTARKNAVNGNADAGEVSNGFKDLVNTTSHANITIHDLSGNLSIFGKKILELKNRMDDPTTRKIGSTHSGI